MDLKGTLVKTWRTLTGKAQGRQYALRPRMPLSTRTREVGRSGTKQYGGFITEDANSAFIGQRAIAIYEEMRKTDATVAAVLDALKLPILAAEWRIDSADAKDSLQNEMAEFVRKNLFDSLEGGWHEFLRQALGHLEFGFWYFEKVYCIDEEGMICLKKLAARLPTAHYKWEMTSDPKTPGITQCLTTIDKRQDPEANTFPEIPMSKLVVFTHKKEGDNYEGISVLRSAYKHYHFKDTLYRIDGTKHERGAGILNIGLPPNHTEEDTADAEDMGENFKLNDKAYIVRPNGWDVALLSDGIKEQSSGLMVSVDHHDIKIMMNMLAQFLNLGNGDSGSFSLSKDQTSFFAMALMAVANNIACTMNAQCIQELIDLNYGPQKIYPKLCPPKVGDINLDLLSNALQRLVQSKLIKVDGNLKSWVHDTFGLPKAKPEDFEDEADAGDPAAAVDPDPNAPPSKDPAALPAREGEYAEMRYWRQLTAAEKRVKFAEINKGFDDTEGEIADELAKLTEEQKKKMLKDAERIIDSDDIGAVDDLSLLKSGEVASVVSEQAKKSLEVGKAAAAGEMGVAIPATTSYAKKVLASKIGLYIKKREDRITDAVKARLIDLMNNDVGKAQALFEVEKIIDKNAQAANNELTGKIGVEFFNEGRYLTFDDMKEQMHGLQRSEILDDRTCATCMSIDGRVVSPSDPFAQMDQIHDRCRGIWVGILKSDRDLPKVQAVPKSILNRFDTSDGVPSINAYNPLEKPIVKKGSRVDRKIKDGELDV